MDNIGGKERSLRITTIDFTSKGGASNMGRFSVLGLPFHVFFGNPLWGHQGPLGTPVLPSSTVRYGWHFPEMGKIVTENLAYAKVWKGNRVPNSPFICWFSVLGSPLLVVVDFFAFLFLLLLLLLFLASLYCYVC